VAERYLEFAIVAIPLRVFGLRFYAEDGIRDSISNNTPIFFINDRRRFDDVINSGWVLRRDCVEVETVMPKDAH